MKLKGYLFLTGIVMFVTLMFGFSAINDDSPFSRSSSQLKKDIFNGMRIQHSEPIVTDNPGSQLSESFESASFPPAGWTKLNPDGGTGWARSTVPAVIPGWGSAVTTTTPPGGGNAIAYATYTTGGETSNDQWLVTPQLTDIKPTDSLSFWVRWWPNGFADKVEVRISTTVNNNPAAFSILVMEKTYTAGSTEPGWERFAFLLDNLVNPGDDIYIAFRETVADNWEDGAVIGIDLVEVKSPGAPVPPAITYTPLGNTTSTGNRNLNNVTITDDGTVASGSNAPRVYWKVNSGSWNSSATTGNTGDIYSFTIGTTGLNAFDQVQYFVVAQDNDGNVSAQPGAGFAATSVNNITSYPSVPNSYIINPDPNFGSNGQTGNNLYYYANSSAGASGAPSQPTFNWRDTTGSTSLIVNRVNTSTFGAGDIDDGRYDILAQLPPGNSIRFFGTDYTNFYIGTNGIVGFTAFVPGSTWNVGSASITGLPQNFIPTMSTAIFPLWIDMNFSDVDVPVNRLSYKITASEIIITYDRAPLYNTSAEANQYVSFQVVISHSASPTANSLIVVQFNDAASGSTFINQYNTNTLPAHIAGLQGSNSASQVLQYRYRSATTLITDGPLFSSPLAVAYGPNVNALPVELSSFTASVNRRDVHLNWTTASEMNNSGFDIERKAGGGETWSKAAFIQGSGTTGEAKNYSFTDRGLNTGKYSYRLKQIDYNGNFEYFNLSTEVNIGVPDRYDLSQNYPNPFNPSTKINFDLPFDSKVAVSIFDITGREIATLVNDVRPAGYYTLTFDGRNFASGMYFYRIVAEGGTQQYVMTKKMMLIK